MKAVQCNLQREHYIKMAVQTVLHNHKHQLPMIAKEEKLLDQITWEITSLAKHLEQLTNETLKGLE